MITLTLIGKVLGVAAYMAFECWLGRTEKVKAGSLLELVVTPFIREKIKNDN
jgi:hypothetical protein